MGIMETIARIRHRAMMEILNLQPIPDAPAPKAEWPEWVQQDQRNLKDDVKLRILSLNAWGLPISPKCTERAFEVGNLLQEEWEVVVLQEIWHRRERNIIISAAEKAGFHYYHYFHPAVGFPLPIGYDSFGTGLLVLSKFPIIGVMYHAFSLSGRPYALHEADFLANKGCGLLRLKTPAGQIDLYATHLIANYNHLGQPGPGDRYLAHRTAQSYELVRFISSTSRNNLVVVCGDFNSPSDCLVLRIPREIIHLRDAFTDTNNSDGLTFATEDNKYSHGEHPMRMDYVLYKIAKQQKDTPGWQLVDCDVYKGFFTDSKGEKCPISDHFGVKAEFVFGKTRPKACEQALGENSKEKMSPIAKMCQTRTCPHCDNALGDRKYSSESSLTSMRCLEDIHEAINTGRRDAISRRSGHLRRSGLSFLALLLTLWSKSSYWEDNTVYFLILILTIHTILEYILAFFFVTLECSSFTELGNQIRLHLHSEKANEAVS